MKNVIIKKENTAKINQLTLAFMLGGLILIAAITIGVYLRVSTEAKVKELHIVAVVGQQEQVAYSYDNIDSLECVELLKVGAKIGITEEENVNYYTVGGISEFKMYKMNIADTAGSLVVKCKNQDLQDFYLVTLKKIH